MKNEKLKINRGLTLMEILVVVSILSIVFGMTFGAMRVYDISTAIGSTKSRLSAEATQALNKMKEGLAKSGIARISINNTTTPNEITFQIPLPGLGNFGYPLWGDGVEENNTIRYYLNNSRLVKERFNTTANAAADEVILANDIINLSFTNSSNAVIMNVTAGKAMQRGIIPAMNVTMSGQVDLRN